METYQSHEDGGGTRFTYCVVPLRFWRRLATTTCAVALGALAGWAAVQEGAFSPAAGAVAVLAVLGVCGGLLMGQAWIDRARSARAWLKLTAAGLEARDWRGRKRAIAWHDVVEVVWSRRTRRGDPPLGAVIIVRGRSSRVTIADTAELPGADAFLQLLRGYARLTHTHREWVPFGEELHYTREPEQRA